MAFTIQGNFIIMTKTKRQNKKINNSFDYQVFNETESIKSASLLQIFTNKEAKPKTNCNWFYVILDEDGYQIGSASGYVNLCDCSQCSNPENQLAEYFSIVSALTLVHALMPTAQISLWISSEGLFADRSEELFGSYLHKCPALDKLTKQLDALLLKLKPEVFEYTYKNKEIITVWF